MTDKPKGALELIYGGKPYGKACPRPDGLWDCIDRHGQVLGLPFPNRARAVDALVTIAQRAGTYGHTIAVRPISGQSL